MFRRRLPPILLVIGLGFVACQGEVIVVVDDDGGATAATSTGMGGASSATTGPVTSTSEVSTSVATTNTISTTTAVVSTSSGGVDCFAAPDCVSCFCDENPAGCEAYFGGIVDSIYCGESCSAACSVFCADPEVEVPDPTCEGCVNGGGLSDADIDTFIAECTAAPGCAQFANDVQDCPF